MTWTKVSQIANAGAESKCPKCGRGPRVKHTYEYGGVTRDDSYCGRCGASWPIEAGGFDPKKAAAADRD